MKRENHKRCDTLEFWEDGTSKLEPRSCLLIFNTFYLRRKFKSTVSYFLLSCVIKTCMLYHNVSVFPCIPEIQWVISFIVYACYKPTFRQLVELGIFYFYCIARGNLRTILAKGFYKLLTLNFSYMNLFIGTLSVRKVN